MVLLRTHTLYQRCIDCPVDPALGALICNCDRKSGFLSPLSMGGRPGKHARADEQCLRKSRPLGRAPRCVGPAARMSASEPARCGSVDKGRKTAALIIFSALHSVANGLATNYGNNSPDAASWRMHPQPAGGGGRRRAGASRTRESSLVRRLPVSSGCKSTFKT